MINKTRLIRLTQKLISIDSQNPPGDERKIAVFVKRYLDKLGLKTKLYEFSRQSTPGQAGSRSLTYSLAGKKKRLNIVATLEGSSKKHSLLITPHLDTVPAGKSWHFDPFRGQIRGAKMYGLGTTDCKGNLAVGLEAINSIVEDGTILDYNLIFAATADEESGSDLGLIPLLEKNIITADAAIVLDSDDLDIIITQKGLIHLKVKITGKKAHGAYTWQGVNAIDISVDILHELKKHKFTFSKNKYLKGPTLNIGTIKGGDKVNVVSDWCEFELDIRFLPGMSEKAILKYLKSVIVKYAKKFQIEIEGIQKPYQIHKNHPLVKYWAKAARKSKITSHIKGSEGATTISFFQQKNIPAIATGAGSKNCAHIADEYVIVDNLYKGAMVLEEFMKIYRFDL
jgi:succinyl-diaminopimelate desuccinylase